MSYFSFANFVFLHAGTSPIVSETVLSLMFVALGILLVGLGFGYVVKTKENLLQHRWMLTSVLVLTLVPVFLVMVPTMYRFYVDSDVQVFSSISILQIFHGAIAVPALTTAVVYASGKLPKNVRKGMRWAAVFWIASMVLGVLVFLQMMGLLPALSMPGM
jgi:uncharacterized membrane protein YozB (DUF420 family)